MSTSKQEQEAIREKIRRLENRQKILLNRKADAERKARTHRLIERGAILESVFPETAPYVGRAGQGISANITALQRGHEVAASPEGRTYTP